MECQIGRVSFVAFRIIFDFLTHNVVFPSVVYEESLLLKERHFRHLVIIGAGSLSSVTCRSNTLLIRNVCFGCLVSIEQALLVFCLYYRQAATHIVNKVFI